MDLKISPIVAVSGIAASFLIFYTGYSKKTKKVQLSDTLDVVLCRKGVSKSIHQLNKVAGLTGLTSLGLAFIPKVETIVEPTTTLAPLTSWKLLSVSTFTLCAHAAYSVWYFYGTMKMPMLASYKSVFSQLMSKDAKEQLKAKRKVGIVFGSFALGGLELWFLTQAGIGDSVGLDSLTLTRDALGIVSLVGGLLHFYLIEVDIVGNLPVRPFGYLAFLLPTVSLGLQALEYIRK